MNSSMKIAAFIFLVLVLLSCNTEKENTTCVLDNERILTPKQIVKLDSLFKDHERKTSNEIVLVTTPGYGSDSSILFYSVNFSRKLGIGKKNENNGVLIVFSMVNRETRIATGYGTEKVLKDDMAKKIIDSIMLPQFRNANYFEGLWNGCKAITNFLERPENKIR